MGDLVMFQQMGFGIAIALLIDATLVRSVLVPAAMTLLGRWNWYLPPWLDWLPHVEVERAQAEHAVGSPLWVGGGTGGAKLAAWNRRPGSRLGSGSARCSRSFTAVSTAVLARRRSTSWVVASAVLP